MFKPELEVSEEVYQDIRDKYIFISDTTHLEIYKGYLPRLYQGLDRLASGGTAPDFHITKILSREGYISTYYNWLTDKDRSAMCFYPMRRIMDETAYLCAGCGQHTSGFRTLCKACLGDISWDE
jgi:hypothetical protein